MSNLNLLLLGPPRLEHDGAVLEIGRRKALALLAYLAVTGEAHRREALAALFWPEHDHSRAHAYLRRDLSVLNRALGNGWLEVSRESIDLQKGEGYWFDVNQFQRLLETHRAHGHAIADLCEDCIRDLAEAAALYRGDFMAGFTLPDSPEFDEWQFFQTENLRGELVGGLEKLVRGYSMRGEFEQAIPYGRRWLSLDPFHEPAYRQLMQVYACAGQKAAALRQYDECVRILDEELGVPPDAETMRLYETIKTRRDPPPSQAVGEELREDLAFGTRAQAPRHNLPAQLTPLVGRDAELTELDHLLRDQDVRLVTLLGPGGMGKTHLSLEAAAAQLPNFSHGVFFVPLAPLERPDPVIATIGQSLGISFRGEETPQQQLINYLREKCLLLVMDNFEHLLEAVPEVVSLLQAAPEIKVLVTSRARLSVQGEHLFPIGGLRYRPEESDSAEDVDHYPAVRLFVQAAQRIQPGFLLSSSNTADVADICGIVEGMPLGILLAAAWMELLTPGEISARISNEIGQSLDFLETDLRDMPARHRSLRAVFDSTLALLTEQERRIFAELSVFRGGFTPGAAQQVTGATLRVLIRLVEKSFLHRTSEGRFEVHELLRQYADDDLMQSAGAYESVRDQHSAFYAAFISEREQDLKHVGHQALLLEIEAEGKNARAAWNWAARYKMMERLLSMLEGLCDFYEFRGRYQEGESACRLAVEQLDTTQSAQEGLLIVRALTWQGIFNRLLGNPELARKQWQSSSVFLDSEEMANQDTRLERATLFLHRGIADVQASDYVAAKAMYAQSLDLFRVLDHQWGMGKVLDEMGFLAWNIGKYEEAQGNLEASLEIRQVLGDRRGIARVLQGLGILAMFRGELEKSEHLYRKRLAIYKEINDSFGMINAIGSIGDLYVRMGEFGEAGRLLEKSVSRYKEMGLRYFLAIDIMFLSDSYIHLGRYEQAQEQLQAGLAHARSQGYRRIIAATLSRLGTIATAKGQYGKATQLLEESVDIFEATGRRAELDEALGLLAGVNLLLGDKNGAQQHLAGALKKTAAGSFFIYRLQILPPLCLFLAKSSEEERAVELYAMVSSYPFVSKSRWFSDVYENRIRESISSLSPDLVAKARERGQARDLDETINELLAEFT